MVKDLFINEKLLVSLDNNKLKVVLVGEQYQSFHPKELKNDSYSFIRNLPHIMDRLKNGNTIESSRKNDMILSLLTADKKEAEGYSYEGSIRNLEQSLQEEKETKRRR
jgi:hypothetical protein